LLASVLLAASHGFLNRAREPTGTPSAKAVLKQLIGNLTVGPSKRGHRL